jgi:GDP/UDP-N,N'-diacetylbacillosamine 2-epimerase (hydrolysing)
MSHLHFVAAEEYRQRVIQMGEHPDRVFLVGGLGVDSIRRLKLLNRSELEAALDLKLGEKSLLVTFHTATLDATAAKIQMAELLEALAALNDTRLIFTLPNADTDGRSLAGMVRRFVEQHANARVYSSLGQLRYLSCIAHVDGVIGNSSSGLAEAPSFRKGTVNIGDRQRGRLQAGSVINCEPTRAGISDALRTLYSSDFQASLSQVTNPYGDGGASERIVALMNGQSLDGLAKKAFYDLPCVASIADI